MKSLNSYSIGLDIGTESIGWAILNDDNRIPKFKKQNMWGVRLLPEADTAAKRRGYRSIRRRLDRRKQRIAVLQDLMAEDVLKKDDAFFHRMKETFLNKEDRRLEHISSALQKELLPADVNLFRYPSIYDLRNYLVNTEEKVDIRLVYLAIHHIVKYRGNFLFEGQDITNILQGEDVAGILADAIDNINELKDTYISYDETVLSGIIEKLKNPLLTRKEKAEHAVNSLAYDSGDKNAVVALANAITGLSFKINSLFNYDEKKSMKFSEEPDFGEFGLIDEAISVLESLKKVYSWQICQVVLGDQKNISASMIQRYNKHLKDLKILKCFIKTHCKSKYGLVFRENQPKLNNYSAYIKNHKYYIKKCTRNDFYGFLSNEILGQFEDEKIISTKNYKYIVEEIEKEEFLPLLRTKENGAIPNQFHRYELEQIILKQGNYYPTLKENGEKILSLCSFRVPYYIGPLNKSSEFAWLDRKPGEIFPWNFEEQVSILESAEGFITRMTNHCTYFRKELVLPKHSLLYEEYMLLNRLNKLTINGEPFEKKLSVLVKQRLVSELFKVRKNIKPSDIEEWLSSNTVYGQDIKIGGLSEKDKLDVSMNSYHDMLRIFKVFDENNRKQMNKYENIIRWVTLFSDKDMLRKKIGSVYPEIDKNIMDQICKLKYTGWGRFSEAFLRFPVMYKNQRMQIIEVFRNTFMNLNQILAYRDFEMDKAIALHRMTGSLQDSIDAVSSSPAVKRSVREVIKLINELSKVIGHDPINIFIEFARERQKYPKKTKSRVDLISELLESPGIDSYFKNELKRCKEEKKPINDRLLLYFTQLGKCMYTGEALDIDLLQTYEIDHILPRSAIKDDSLDNRVLVKGTANQYKAESLLLNEKTRRERSGFWRHLNDLRLISSKKLNNLLRSEISENDLERFINRQLVETRQIAKNLKGLLEEFYPQIEISAIHARLLTDTREKYDLYKLRELNDYHHAYDAFLACLLGRFSNLLLLGNIDDPFRTFRLFRSNNVIRNNKYGYVLGAFENGLVDPDTGEILFDHNDTIRYMKEVYHYKDCFITKKPEIFTGEFWNQTIQPKSGNGSICIKKGLDVKNYGGYSGVQIACCAAITYYDGNKQLSYMTGISVRDFYEYGQNIEGLTEHLRKEFNDKSLKILRYPIYKNQIMYYKGNKLFIASDTEANNAQQLLVDRRYNKMLYAIEKGREDSIDYGDEMESFYGHYINKLRRYYPIFGNIADKLDNRKKEFSELSDSNKSELISLLLKITKANKECVDLTKFKTIGLKSGQGRICNRTFHLKNMTLLDQSITGLFEKQQRFDRI